MDLGKKTDSIVQVASALLILNALCTGCCIDATSSMLSGVDFNNNSDFWLPRYKYISQVGSESMLGLVSLLVSVEVIPFLRDDST